MHIGGTITDPQVTYSLICAIRTENVGPDYGAGFSNDDEVHDDIELAQSNGQPLKVYDDQASYGNFSDLERVVQQLGLTFNRGADAYMEHDGDIVWWRPGMDSPDSTSADQSANPMVGLEAVRNAYGNGTLGALIDSYTPCQVPAIVLAYPEATPPPAENDDSNDRLRGIDLD